MRRIILKILALIVLACLCSVGFTVLHSFGPYSGKVVDKESGEPLEGAVVFLSFYTSGFFGVSSYAGAAEFLTDSKGEFKIPAQWVFHPQIWAEWDWQPDVIIFKPGYGAFPRHKKTTANDAHPGTLLEDTYMTIKLPKLKTVEERRENEGSFYISTDIPFEKRKKIFALRNIERKQVDFEPLPPPTPR